ncbi:MAG: VWA domain-containing protein [Deltaproteobacteria bacterium]|nr:MAG: VWA domain-containing protein [Deltaproteobacteria bacterium]
MRSRILAFVQALRAEGIDVSLAETMDAVRAVAAAGVQREVLRESLAACLVKDEEDRPVFDRLFDASFPLVGAEREAGRRRKRVAGGGGALATASGRGAASGRGRPAEEAADPRRREPSPVRTPSASRETARAEHAPARRDTSDQARRPGRLARRLALMQLPFRDFTARDVQEARDLVRELGRRLRARLARRQRQARRGRLDFRRTIRASMSSGGVPARPRFRARRPARPDLVALCDLSGSVAAASELMLGLVAPAADWFRRAHLFAYVDRLCPVSIEDGHVAPGGPLDLHARSDFGRVLDELWRERRDLLTRATLLLVLGDARNNRRPPRADLLRAVRDRVERLVWLVPEPRTRWDTGDSVLSRYAPLCDALFECIDLAALVAAVRRTL